MGAVDLSPDLVTKLGAGVVAVASATLTAWVAAPFAWRSFRQHHMAAHRGTGLGYTGIFLQGAVEHRNSNRVHASTHRQP